ncbi:MAG: anthranilate synthase component I family protein [Candidatus Micrarchaeota archaeon]|nr:anthranilate synthase component I family protein [Candidatus Micrarchaeota archaeon]
MIFKKLKTSLNPYQMYILVNREFRESFLLESLEGTERLARFSFIGFDPKKHVSAKGNLVSVDGVQAVEQQPIRALAREIPKRQVEMEGFVGGAVGYFSYDYARSLEKLPSKNPDELGFPDFEFGIFDDCVIYDHRHKSVHYLSHTEDRSEQLLSLCSKELFTGPFESGTPVANAGQKEYESVVQKAKEYIESGDIFQVVLSRRYSLPFEGNPLRFYNYLKQTNPSPYMYFLSFGDRKIIGSSPENLVRVEGRKIDSYATLAGTMPRGQTHEEDAALEKKLLTDEKERAEHLMLVDLTRNDISKVAKPGSVCVPELLEVHKYRHVQHLSSHVVGELADGRDCFDALDAIFPAGTLTGAPKVRAMEIIEELEDTRRGPYGGAVGYFSFNGNCDFAINIRSLVANRQTAHVQAGAGIVSDSVPAREYAETEHKMRALLSALEGK